MSDMENTNSGGRSLRDQVSSQLEKAARESTLAAIKAVEVKRREAQKLVKQYDLEIEKIIADYEAGL